MASELGSPRYERWNEALHRLIGLGSRALPALIVEMRARHKDPEFTSRAAMALKGMGPRRLKPVADYLQSVVEPLPLEVLVDVVASIGDKPLIYRLRDLIASLDQREVGANGFAGPDPYARVRGKAHLALARIGSRVAVADLKKTLADPSRRVDAELLAAVAKIGTRHELAGLVAAYCRENTSWMRAQIRDVFSQIVRREKIRRRDSLFDALAKQFGGALAEILAQPGTEVPDAPPLPGLRPRPHRRPPDH